jgi:hypothetical protein
LVTGRKTDKNTPTVEINGGERLQLRERIRDNKRERERERESEGHYISN